MANLYLAEPSASPRAPLSRPPLFAFALSPIGRLRAGFIFTVLTALTMMLPQQAHAELGGGKDTDIITGVITNGFAGILECLEDIKENGISVAITNDPLLVELAEDACEKLNEVIDNTATTATNTTELLECLTALKVVNEEGFEAVCDKLDAILEGPLAVTGSVEIVGDLPPVTIDGTVLVEIVNDALNVADTNALACLEDIKKSLGSLEVGITNDPLNVTDTNALACLVDLKTALSNLTDAVESGLAITNTPLEVVNKGPVDLSDITNYCLTVSNKVCAPVEAKGLVCTEWCAEFVLGSRVKGQGTDFVLGDLVGADWSALVAAIEATGGTVTLASRYTDSGLALADSEGVTICFPYLFADTTLAWQTFLPGSFVVDFAETLKPCSTPAGGSEIDTTALEDLLTKQLDQYCDKAPVTHVYVQGVGTSVPAGLKSVTINNITGITTINGGFALGNNRRVDSISYNATESDCVTGLLPAFALSGGTWQWSGLQPVE